jgi:hypothetical protein
MENILISGIGGPTPRSIARTVRKFNPEYKIIGVDCNRKAYGFYMNDLVDEAMVIPKVSDPEYWPAMHRIIKEKKIDMAFIQPEVEVIEWGNYYKTHSKYPCPVLLPYVDMAAKLIDKAEMAEILHGTTYIPKTIKITQQNPKADEVESQIGFPCWIRATQGSGGLGSLKLMDKSSLVSWLFINSDLQEFTVSEFLSGRHLATQMLYLDGQLVTAASLECAEYVMASIAPSKVTGNTSFGRFLNENRILEFCDQCIRFIEKKLGSKAHGVLSFDLKEDAMGNLKVTEVNIRHMAYTGVMANVGFDLVADTIAYLKGTLKVSSKQTYYRYGGNDLVFLRDVDIEPIVIKESELLH